MPEPLSNFSFQRLLDLPLHLCPKAILSSVTCAHPSYITHGLPFILVIPSIGMDLKVFIHFFSKESSVASLVGDHLLLRNFEPYGIIFMNVCVATTVAVEMLL
jgi:hypothetical protein